MEDNSSGASSDSDNALLSAGGKRPSIGRNAATQTPEMPRHEIRVDAATEIYNPGMKPPTGAREDSSIMVYKLDTQKPLSELEQDAKNLAIPDVVVEYIKDGMGGNTNPAFEPQELIVVRTPSSISLRDDVAQSEMKNGVPLLQMGGMSLLSAMDPSLRASTTSLCRSAPPSPTFGYRPLESETSHVYTILSPVRYVEKEMEIRLMAQLQEQMERERANARKFEYNPAPVEYENRRRRLQCATDVCSTMFLVPGILIAVVAPILLVPMFLMPLKYYIPLVALFIATGAIAVMALAVSGLLGNIVWHYDPAKTRLRPRLHCGTGPLRHFWGNGLYPEDSDRLYAEKV